MRNKSTQAREPRGTDIRKLRRSRIGVTSYTLRHLAEALKARRQYIGGSTIVLVGFQDCTDDGARAHAVEIISSLARNGAHVRHVSTRNTSFGEYRETLAETMSGADAILLDTDNEYFRALRPRELRTMGGPIIIIPTSLHV